MKIIIKLILSLALIFSTLTPGDFTAYAGGNSSTLSPQSRSKPSAKIVKIADGYIIDDDEKQAETVGDDFKKDIEQVYLNVLSRQAEEIGLSKSGLQTLIREHAQKISTGRSQVNNEQGTLPDITSVHAYTEIAAEERGQILIKLKDTIDEHNKMRLAKLIEVYNYGKNTHKLSLDLVDIATLNASTTIFHDVPEKYIFKHGLFKDEKGVYWTFKKMQKGFPEWGDWQKNLRQRELFAYLLLHHTSNQGEIRVLTKEDVQHSPALAPFADNVDEYYLSRLVIDGNVENSSFPHKEIRQANSAIFVANILIRKWDPHLWNLVPFRDVPVSIDNDVAFGFNAQPNPMDSKHFKRFEFQFLDGYVYVMFRLGKILDMNKASEGSPNQQLNSLVRAGAHIFDKLKHNPEELVNETVSAIDRFGIGDCAMAANMLDEHYIRESIFEHKKIENIRKTAIEAGYNGKELDDVVVMINENCQTLGRDVNEILKAITGRDYGFDKIDHEFEVSTESKWGEAFIDKLLLRAREAKQRNEKVIVGIDSSWIPKEQLPYIQGLLSELSRLSMKRGLDNVIIRRTAGPELAELIENEVVKTGTPLSNIVILGDGNVLSRNVFDVLRPGIDPKNWAFFAAVETPENFPGNSYVRLVEMLTAAVNLAFGGSASVATSYLKIVQDSARIFRFIIPKAEPMDLNALKEIYNSQIKVLTAA